MTQDNSGLEELKCIWPWLQDEHSVPSGVAACHFGVRSHVKLGGLSLLYIVMSPAGGFVPHWLYIEYFQTS